MTQACALFAQEDVADQVSAWLRRTFGPLRYGAMKAADAASFGPHQVSARTAERWLRSKKSKPCQVSIEILAARYEDLEQELEQSRRILREAIQRPVGIRGAMAKADAGATTDGISVRGDKGRA